MFLKRRNDSMFGQSTAVHVKQQPGARAGVSDSVHRLHVA